MYEKDVATALGRRLYSVLVVHYWGVMIGITHMVSLCCLIALTVHIKKYNNGNHIPL
jgi:hypothetical protein